MGNLKELKITKEFVSVLSQQLKEMSFDVSNLEEGCNEKQSEVNCRIFGKGVSIYVEYDILYSFVVTGKETQEHPEEGNEFKDVSNVDVLVHDEDGEEIFFLSVNELEMLNELRGIAKKEIQKFI